MKKNGYLLTKEISMNIIKFIAPYKGELEIWYQKNISFKTDILLIFSTIISILRPSSNFVYKLFPNLPEKPNHLKI